MLSVMNAPVVRPIGFELMTLPGLSRIAVDREDDDLLTPMERFVASNWLYGSGSINCDARFIYVGPANDLEAIKNYVHWFRGWPRPTCVQREIERVFFWCILELRKPFSSALIPN